MSGEYVTRVLRLARAATGLATVASALLLSRSAAADVTLADEDGWTVFINGRVQTFLNYSSGDGFPRQVLDGAGQQVELLGGGQSSGDAPIEVDPTAPLTEQGTVQDLRLRTGFVGNVLGFGIRKQINPETAVQAYTAVTVYIDSTNRRKYQEVQPDWRESYLRLTAPWGSLTAGRTLTLFSRGATEITYLYAFSYGLGWPGSVSNLSGNGPGAGHVGFGVLGNGFGAGVAYATPVLGGAQLTVGLYDANNIPGSGTLERTRYPRAEGEFTYEMKLGTAGMFKLFANGAWQKIYEKNGTKDQTISGVGYGGRLEVGPVHLGLAGHFGTGIGLDFALQPHPSGWHPTDKEFRNVDGYYAQLMIKPNPVFQVSAGAGITRVKRLTNDVVDIKDDDANPATPSADDDVNPGADPVGFIPIKQQLGFSGGVTFHATNNIHLTLEYFRAMFQWHQPVPAPPEGGNPEQSFHVVNAGVTYDF